ncbi:MAG: DUF2062 domain-containing protein [Betaproteobacteria bacterium]|nr:DUF2062 domain-containing protein [Betaproteobacteria bacterium]
MWRKLFERTKRFIQRWYVRLIRIKATPHNIAIGVAAGVFAGLLPVLPFQTVLAIALAFVVRGSKIAAALGTWVTNPLNWVPFYMLCYYVGRIVVPFDVPPFNPSRIEMAEMIEMGWKFFAVMMTGGLVIAIPSAVVSYFVFRKIVGKYQARRKAKLFTRPLSIEYYAAYLVLGSLK